MRLLFAEDEKSLSRAITAILKKNHYEVDAVYDGEDTSRNSETGGYGIGLSIAQAVVQMHKGKISAAAVNDHKIQLSVLLPIRSGRTS